MVADLNGSKDTVTMLACLNNCFPHAKVTEGFSYICTILFLFVRETLSSSRSSGRLPAPAAAPAGAQPCSAEVTKTSLTRAQA